MNTLTIKGMSAYNDGDLIRLTVFAIGDNYGQAAEVVPTYGDTVLAAKTAYYGTNPDPAVDAEPSLQWEFLADSSIDTLSFTWGKAEGATTSAGFNGFMLTAGSPDLGEVTSVVLSPENTVVINGADDIMLKSVADFSEAGGLDVTVGGNTSYVSSNPSVASVSSGGAVTPLSAGTTTITVTVTGDASSSATDTATVTVEDIVSLDLSVDENFLLVSGFTTTVHATGSSASLTDVPLNDYSSISFETDEEESATVSDVGLVTPGAIEGVASITVSFSGTSETVNIGVEEATSVTGTFNPDNKLIVDGFSSPIDVTVSSANITDLPVNSLALATFVSTNDSMGTVDVDGVVTPGSVKGEAAINITWDGGISTSAPFIVGDLTPKPTNLRHRYSFNGSNETVTDPDSGEETTSPASIVVADSANGADGVIESTGALYNDEGNQLILPGGAANGPGAFVDLPNGIISSLPAALTLELWASRTSTQTWERFFDLGSSTGVEGTSGTGKTYLVLIAQNGDDANVHTAFTLNSNGNEAPNLDGLEGSGVDEMRHYVVTYDSDEGIMNLYIDGDLAVSGPVPPGQAAAQLNDINNWLGRSQWGNPRMAGSFDEFRVYEGTMDADEVYDSMIAGPDAPIDFTPLPSDETVRIISVGYDVSAPSYSITFESENTKQYQVMVSDDLTGFAPAANGLITASGDVTTYTDTTVAGDDKRFYTVEPVE